MQVEEDDEKKSKNNWEGVTLSGKKDQVRDGSAQVQRLSEPE